MREEEILTLQSAVELDHLHNQGRLLKALKANQISKEEFIASIFSIVQKKNAQNETQKLLSTIANATSDGVLGDYWEKQEPSLKDRILNNLIFNKDGNLNYRNIKRFGSNIIWIIVIVFGSGTYVYIYLKNKINNRSSQKRKIYKREINKVLQRDEHIEMIRNKCKSNLELINKLLENENISDEEREHYEKEKEKFENLLNNNDNFVGDIVGA